jgi:hypothetical protein
MKYPFLPKSNLKLELGEYWNLPLSNGCNAFFVILDIPAKKDRMRIFIGMLDEMAREEKLDPNKEYTKILWQSSVHIKTIRECRGLIQGKIKPIVPEERLDSAGGKYCRVMRGYTAVRWANKNDIANLKVRTTSGYNVARIVAEKHWIKDNTYKASPCQ